LVEIMAALGEKQQDGKVTGERIAKVIARSGLCSRRDAEALIGEKRVSVNGAVIESAALDILPVDKVLVDGKPLARREPPRLWRYYKPKGRVTTHKDPEGRPTVFEALPEDLPRLISVGRLDFNTEGLLLLTNDGDLARHLELPSTGWTRRYRVRAYGRIDQSRLQELAGGLTVGKVNYGAVEATLEREQGDNVWISLSLREGKNREVRRIMEHLELAVNRLIRISFGPFMLGELEPGQIEEVKTSVLKDQLGPRLSRQLGVQREPMREDRRLQPARAKATYLRRKPGAPVRPVRPVEEPRPLRRRRIVSMDGSEAPKVEFVPERKPRLDRFGQGSNRRGGEHPRPERDDRARPAGREGGQRRGKAADYKPREARDGDSRPDRMQSRNHAAPFRKKPGDGAGGRPRFDRDARGGSSSAERTPRGDRGFGDRPAFTPRNGASEDGARPARTFRSERTEGSPRPQFRRDADGTRNSFENRKPREERAERSRSALRPKTSRTHAAADDRKPRERTEEESRSQFRRNAERGSRGVFESRKPREERPRAQSRQDETSGGKAQGNRDAGARSGYRAGGHRRDEHRAGAASFNRRETGESQGTAEKSERPAFRSGSDRRREGRPAGNSFKQRERTTGKGPFKNRKPGERAAFKGSGDKPGEKRAGAKPFLRHKGPTSGPRPAGSRKPRPETDQGDS
jgi:23S rRNA pseudouridine2605 synthase